MTAALKLIAETAFRLYEQKRLSHEALVRILEKCVNAAATENGYADEHDLPFSEKDSSDAS